MNAILSVNQNANISHTFPLADKKSENKVSDEKLKNVALPVISFNAKSKVPGSPAGALFAALTFVGASVVGATMPAADTPSVGVPTLVVGAVVGGALVLASPVAAPLLIVGAAIGSLGAYMFACAAAALPTPKP